jgi:hypothetical protein
MGIFDWLGYEGKHWSPVKVNPYQHLRINKWESR